MTNHEGQPRPPSQPTNTRDTVGQKHTHSKVREGQQGDPTCKPSRQHLNWSTLTQGAKPQLPQQASRAREAKKKKGRAEAQPTSPGKQHTLQALRKSTAHGSKPSGAARTLQPNPRSRPANWSQTC